MNQNKPAVVKKLQERFRNISVGRGLYIAFVMPTMLSMFSTRAFAADTIWTKASAIMQDVYKQILSIKTPWCWRIWIWSTGSSEPESQFPTDRY